MTDYNVATYNPSTGKLGVPQGADRYTFPKDVHFESNVSTDGTIDGRDLAADGTRLDLLTYAGAINLDTRFTQVDALQTKQDFLTVTQAVDLDAMETKTNWITVTQAVDLDVIEARVNALDAAVVLKGDWDATTPGTFPVSTIAGESWIVSVAGTVAAVDFEIGDRIVALVDGASTSVYTGQWLKLDYTDLVTSVAGRTGAVVLVEADITDLQGYLLPVDLDSIAKINALCSETLLVDGASVTSFLFTPGAAPAYAEGKLFYDSSRGTLSYYTDDPDITMNIGEENWIHVRNDTGVTINDGTPVYISGVSGGVPQISKIIADGERCVGIATSDISTGTIGHVTTHGTVTGPDLTSFSVGDTLYVSAITPGVLVNTPPAYPLTAIEVGVVLDNSNPGIMLVDIEHHGNANVINKSYNFSARTAASGEYFLGGYYDYAAADANLTQAATTVTHGTATAPYAAHAFMVFGAGSTDGTNITVTVTGTSITDAGVRTPADSEVLYNGTVAALTLNDYLETSKKWLGQVTYTLTSDGVNFTCDFNYGYAKYEDFHNFNFSLRAIEFVGLADATDTSFNIELLHHKSAGWTYHATAFVAGAAAEEDMNTDHGTEEDIAAGENFAWKRSVLALSVAGAGSEGILFRVTTGVNNSVAYLNGHVTVTTE